MDRFDITRRGFLKTASSVAAAPYFFSNPKALAAESISANALPRVGVIGCGGIAGANMGAARNRCQVVAVCDVDSDRASAFNAKYTDGNGSIYSDYRELLQRDDLDAVHIATPDHWHAKILIEAMLAGHDVYCEKPLTLTVDEGKLVREVYNKTDCIVQVGTQQRSQFDLFTKAIAIIKDGRLGKINRIVAGIGRGAKSSVIPLAEVPKNYDWNSWVGPAQFSEYRYLPNPDKKHPHTNGHYNFRWWYDFSGGKLTDWGAHHVDIAVWALETNGQTVRPTHVSGTATHPVQFKDGNPVEHDRYNTAIDFDLKVDVADGTELLIQSEGRNGVLIEGDKGRIFVNRGELAGAPVEALEDNPLPEVAITNAYKGAPQVDTARKGHWANFFYSMQERKEPISDVNSHLKALDICHLSCICARLGRDIQWNPDTQQIVGDELANSMLRRPYREGFEIEGI